MSNLNEQEKSIFFLSPVLTLGADPSKENIEKIARDCIQSGECFSRKDALALIEALHEAEARNTRGVGDEVEQLIIAAEENLRSQVRMSG